MLSAFPCSDELDGDDLTQNAIVSIAHGIEKGQMESCSPICACKCCGQSLVEIDVNRIALKPAVNFLAKQVASPQFLLLQRSNNIWNPPKTV